MRLTEWNRQRAFTLIELLIALVIAGALMTIAVPSYQEYIERARRTTASKDIAVVSLKIESYRNRVGAYPASLADLNATLPLDPWGHAYQYLGIDVVPPPTTNQVRRDKNMNPLNSDYDLYSMGADGQTQKQLTAAKARDDIVRASNGGFIGLASEH
jgi:general secretion pathway protein G